MAAEVTGSEYERMVTEMCAMGFERDQGLPAEPQASKEQEEQQGEGGDDAPASGAEESSLDFLWTLPQFITLRERVQENPSILPQLLQQLGQSNPELLQILSERQEEFIAMLNRPAPPPGVVVPPQPVSGSEQAGPSAGQEQGGTSYINVTAQEKEAIERLKALGFSEKMVVQAYFACEKNENLAANFLLSQGFNDD